MRHSYLRFLGLGVAAFLLLAACGGTSTTPTKVVKVGLVTDVGGLNDKSFNHLADVGLEKAKTDFKIQASVVESKTGDDYIPNLTNFASKSYDLVIGVGFLMQQAIGTVAGQFPRTSTSRSSTAPVPTRRAPTSSSPTSSHSSSRSRTRAPWWESSPECSRRLARRRRTPA